MIDSSQWDWARGCCKLHPGQELPCQACIRTLQPGLIRESVIQEIVSLWKQDPNQLYSKPYTASEINEACERFYKDRLKEVDARLTIESPFDSQFMKSLLYSPYVSNETKERICKIRELWAEHCKIIECRIKSKI